jgi:endonuclease/exonuclease/phosphatase (EEP) superfamily protein YafD
MSGQPTAEPPARSGSRLLRGVRLVLTAVTVVVLVLAVAGKLVRDRNIPFALLSYIPLVPLGLATVLLDLVFLGRCWPRPRFGLTLIGLLTAAWGAALLSAVGTDARPPGGQPEVRLLQWNVHWGGGKDRGKDTTWPVLTKEIHDRSPDIVVLSEAPPDDWMDDLAVREGYTKPAGCGHAHDASPYWYRLYVLARGPVVYEWDRPIPNGHIMSVVTTVKERRVRILVVDGESDPRLSRPDMLNAVTEVIRTQRDKGEPIDILAGDFNTPIRSIGFEGFWENGYRLASRAARGWRATFPAEYPLLDIDHVWLGPGFRLRDCELFGCSASDHRGQLVVFELPPPG